MKIAIIGAQIESGDQRMRVMRQVSVRNHDPFGFSGGTRCVD